MKGSFISVRIADFLKEYPPFEFIGVDALRELASSSKVKFHEDGEIVFSQGQPRDTWLYVIQKGNVRILEEDAEGEHLIDLRGPGDILGLQGIRSEEAYLHTCKTDTETILYGLPRKTFTEVALKSIRARRYLAAYFSLNPAYEWGGSQHKSEPGLPDPGPVTLMRGGLTEVEPPQSDARHHLTTVRETAPLRDVVIRLQSKRVECVLVVDERGRPLGKVTDADLRDRLLEGSVYPQTPVGELMFTDLIAAGPGEDTGGLLLKLARYGKHFLV
ncbi:MAG TPA: cyclic nucleotide-binding domain-containing protein, partial [Oceanipulchritudo sp.]|nr:cyclic nucleotide-binding domain-containing protein [Oceanipulchritudo sp.]